MNCVSFTRNEGYYNLCNTKEKSAQYVFNWGKWQDKANELDLQRSFLIDIDEDNNFSFPTYDALELAIEIELIIGGYWIHSSKSKIKQIVEFLENIKEENRVEMCKDMIEKHRSELEEWKETLLKAEYDLGQKIYYEELERKSE